jgi:hypothetical protein
VDPFRLLLGEERYSACLLWEDRYSAYRRMEVDCCLAWGLALGMACSFVMARFEGLAVVQLEWDR